MGSAKEVACTMLASLALHAAHEAVIPPYRRQEDEEKTISVQPNGVNFIFAAATNHWNAQQLRIDPRDWDPFIWQSVRSSLLNKDAHKE